MTPDDALKLIYILQSLNRRICALESDWEGRGSESCLDEIHELRDAVWPANAEPAAEPNPAGGKENAPND
jgi:hypothetical protein